MARTDANCATCPHWSRHYDGSAEGSCRYLPPRVFILDPAEDDWCLTLFPETDEDEWCSEHPIRKESRNGSH